MSCAVETCDRRAVARGWCNAHYQRWLYHGGDLAADIPIRPHPDQPEPLSCDCDTPAPSRIGECQQCYRLVLTCAACS